MDLEYANFGGKLRGDIEPKRRMRKTKMSDVESIIINDQYIIMIGITLFFTFLALAWRKITLTLLASMCWFISGATHLLASPSTSPLFALVWLYFGIGMIFLVVTFQQAFEYFNYKKKHRMEGPLV